MVFRAAPRYLVFSHSPCSTPGADTLVNATVVSLEDLHRNRAVRSRELRYRLVLRRDGVTVPVIFSGMLSAELRATGATDEGAARACREGMADVLAEVGKGHIEATSFCLGSLALRLISHDAQVRLRLFHPESRRWVSYGLQDQAAVLGRIWGHLLRRASAAQHCSAHQQAETFAVTSSRGCSYVAHA
ncbi:hypothetical protein ABZV67_33360 [Streptomyces sp. NPDC005065]|uniref:hypothetical protein n=1 Tax=unclassified Streptomyces TaxID=2593676 RepID=UPI0033B03BFC